MQHQPDKNQTTEKESSEAGPSHLLSENSEQKKKERNDKFFAEVSYLAFVESIHLHQQNMEYIRRIESESQFAYEQSVKAAKANELNLALLMRDKQQTTEPLSKEQRDKLNQLKEKLEKTIENLENLIKTLSKNLEKQTQVVDELKSQVSNAKKVLASSVEKHFSDEANKSDFKPIRVGVKLPAEWNKMYGADSENCTSVKDSYIDIDKENYKQLGKNIATDIQNSEGSDLEDVSEKNAKSIILYIIAKQLGLNAAKSRILEEKIDDEMLKPAVASILRGLSQNYTIAADQRNVASLEKNLESEILTHQLMAQELKVAETELEARKQEHAAISDALDKNQISEELKENLQQIETNVNESENKLEAVHTSNQETEEQVNEVNDLFADLDKDLEEIKTQDNIDDVKTQIEEVHNKAEAVVSPEKSEKVEAEAEETETPGSVRPG